MPDRTLSNSRLKPVPPSQWLETTAQELLDAFVAAGGSAVRFVAGDDDDLALIADGIRTASEARSYQYVLVDPADLREDGRKPDFHQIDKLFFRVSETVAWSKDAQRLLLAQLKDRGIRLPNDILTTDIDAVAEANDIPDRGGVQEVYRRLVPDLILRDYGMAL